MNEILVPPAGQSASLVPASMTEAMKLADMMASAKLVPGSLQKSPADCLMVVMQAVRWQMDPFAVAQECSVIQGKLMHSGKLVAAVVNARGNLDERLSFEYEGQGDNRTITVSGRLHGETKVRTVTVRISEAKTNNRVWQTQPDQQLMYHGCRVWSRRHTPELMLGVYSPEEFDEPRPSGNGNGQMRDVSPNADPVTLSPAPVEQSPEDLVMFMCNAIDGMTDIGKLNDWTKRHKAAFARLSAEQQAHVRERADNRRGFLAQAPAESEAINAETGEVSEAGADDRFANYDQWVADQEAALKAASDDGQDAIWQEAIAPRINAGEVFPPDVERLMRLLRNAG